MASPYDSTSLIRITLGVFVWPQTYLNTLYLLLAFPLGIAYFVVLVTGFSVGVGTLIIWVGVPILLLVFWISWALTWFERELAVRLLRQSIRARPSEDSIGRVDEAPHNLSLEEKIFIRVWRRLKSHLSKPTTWTGLFYLIAKFPIGIASFVITVVLISVSLGFITIPIHYRWSQTQVGPWHIDTFNEALILLPIGLVMLLITPHVINLTTYLIGHFARLMLGLGLTESSYTTEPRG